MNHRFRLRQIGSHLAIASGSAFGSYLLAIYIDSKKKNTHNRFNQYLNLPQRRAVKYSESNSIVENIQNFWQQSRESQKTIYSLIAANSAIFLAWRIPAFSIYLNRYFLHSINSHPLSMLGSIFSHKSLIHLGFNMLALNSFGTFLHEKMGREQFLAFYISSGMSSSLVSHIYKSFRWNYTPSLGASGAIFGVVGGCAHYPELKVSLIFLPIHSVPISQALPAMMVVKRGKSYESESGTEISESPNFFAGTVSRTVSILGVGTFGLSVLRFNEFPPHFYALSLGFSFLIYLSSSYLISKVTKGLNLENVIGSSSYCGSGCTHFSVIAIFTALITMSGICFSLTNRFIMEVLGILGFDVHMWAVVLLMGSLFSSILFFMAKRELMYFWSKSILATIFCTLTAVKIFYSWDSIRTEASKNLHLPLQISLRSFQEFLTVVGISLLSLFSRSICDGSILKTKNSTDSPTKLLLSDLISCSIGFICFNVILAASGDAFISSVFTDKAFSNLPFRAFISILLSVTILIQSLEYFDSAHNIIADFFMPVIQHKIKLFSRINVRKIFMILLMFSISYFVYESDESPMSFFNAMNYVVCFELSIPFLIIPSCAMIMKARKTTGGFLSINFVAYFMAGITGIILFACCLLGLSSIQSSYIFMMMMENFKFCIISCIASALIYFSGLICDVYFYPPKPSPNNHRTINSYKLPDYGSTYVAEILILVCIFATLSTPVHSFLNLSSDNFFVSAILFVAQSILRIFIHVDLVHLFLNCLFLYGFGRTVALEIGPFHFLSFFLVSGILSEILEQIFTTHTDIYNNFMGLGASGISCALLSRYVFNDELSFRLYFFQLSGHEFLILSVFIDLFLHLSKLLPTIAHSAHLAGTIFGLFFWKYSDKIWSFRNKLSEKLFKSKK